MLHIDGETSCPSLLDGFGVNSPKMCFVALTASWLAEIWCHEDFSRKSHGTSTVMQMERGVK